MNIRHAISNLFFVRKKLKITTLFRKASRTKGSILGLDFLFERIYRVSQNPEKFPGEPFGELFGDFFGFPAPPKSRLDGLSSVESIAKLKYASHLPYLTGHGGVCPSNLLHSMHNLITMK